MTSDTPDPNAQAPDAPEADQQGLSWAPFGVACSAVGPAGSVPSIEELMEMCRDFVCGQPDGERDVFAILREHLEHAGIPCDGELDDAVDPASPIILDLDGNGVDASGMALFDHEGDGFAELSRFVGGADGMLAMDRNGNGIIDDGTELFGSNSVLRNGERAEHGFAALSELDSNSDGRIDASDAAYAQLRVLRLADAPDGAGGKVAKLVALSEAGVASVGTSFAASDHVDQHGNEHRQVGGFTRTDGTAGVMTDVWLQRVESFTAYSRSGIPEHSAEIAALPDLHASGRVYNLRDAMALDDAGRLAPPFYTGERTETRSLRELVQAFGSEQDPASREALLEKILHRWAGAEGVVVRDYWGLDTSRTLHHPEHFAVVEAFYGRQWRAGDDYRNPSAATAAKAEGSYARIRERVFADLTMQTHLSEAMGKVVATKDSATGAVTYDFSEAATVLRASPGLYADFARALLGWTRGNEGLQQQLYAGLTADIQLAWDRRVGTAITGGTGNDHLYGRDGEADVFDSDAGGRDRLHGKGGGDTYWLGKGTGHDAINEARDNAQGGGTDVIRLKAGISAEQVVLGRTERDLHVALLDKTGAMTDSQWVVDHYVDSKARIEEVRLADGSLLYGAEDFALARIRGDSGNDHLYGRDGESDVFDSDAGGRDRLHGKGGGDTYWLGKGTGHDAIHEAHGNAQGGGTDVIQLKEGISAEQVVLGRTDRDLYVALLDKTGAMTDSQWVVDHYVDSKARIEEVRLADGSLLYGAEDFALARIRGDSDNNHLHGRDGESDVFDSDAGGRDRLHGRGGGDTYWLGKGTGHDAINEAHGNAQGGGTDVIQLKEGISAEQVVLGRTDRDLYVALLDKTGAMTDSQWVVDHYVDSKARIEEVRLADGSLLYGAEDFALARIHGGIDNDHLHGRDGESDVFDSDAGGRDRLHGRGGGDTYWLGKGTGHDAINEAHGNAQGGGTDIIQLKAGIGAEQVVLGRTDRDLYVALLDKTGAMTDSQWVVDHYVDSKARIEEVRLADGSLLYGAEDFALARIRGGIDNDHLHGQAGAADVFDGDAGGNDRLHGRSGGDTYWLGIGTGHDEIHEAHDNADGSGTDVVRLKEGIGASQIELRRIRDDLYVLLLGGTDRLRVVNHYADSKARIEEVRLADGSLLYGAEALAQSQPGRVNVYDSTAGGNDRLRGQGGGDTYWMGAGTGHDTIDEAYKNAQGDGTDVVRLKAGIGASQVGLVRTTDDLYVQLLDGSGAVTDSLRVLNYYADSKARIEEVQLSDGSLLYGAADFALARMHGGTGTDWLHGRNGEADVFDSDAGGTDLLHGRGGGDTYWLGKGTGHDGVREAYDNLQADGTDVIRIKEGIGASQVGLARVADDLYVQVLDGTTGAVTDSLRVSGYYADSRARIEEVRLSDGSLLYGAEDFALARIHGGIGTDWLHGRNGEADVFDSDAGGTDLLHGRGGGDTYWLGKGTGHDGVREAYDNPQADGTDVIRIKEGIGASQVGLARVADDLYVQVLDGTTGALTDSLRVSGYYADSRARIEEVRLSDGSLLYGAADFALARMHGGTGTDWLHGRNGEADVFDSDAGGTDFLHGRGGGDTYWLGKGTGHDGIREAYDNPQADGTDVIRIKEGIGASQVVLARTADDLYVQVLDGTTGAVTDSLRVSGHYADSKARIEEVRLSDGNLLYGAADFALARMHGGTGTDWLHGRNGEADVFDSDAGGTDFLHGRGGGDTYWLGKGTGHDGINEAHENAEGDGADVVRLKAGFGASQVGLARTTDDLYVHLLDGTGAVTDSLRVIGHYADSKARIEEVRLADGSLLYGTEAFALARMRGGAGHDHLHGRNGESEVFDSDSGGNDRLHGRGGGDTYWLGKGTGHDEIHEAYDNPEADGKDMVRLKEGIGVSDLRIERLGNDVRIGVLGAPGAGGVRAVDASLRVSNYYATEAAQVEGIGFADGKEWLGQLVLGTALDDELTGSGADEIYWGGGGTDTYRFDQGFGQDVVAGDGGSGQAEFAGMGLDELRFAAEGTDLLVASGSDQARLEGWLAGDSRGVKAAGHELDMGRLAELLAGFDGSGAGDGPSFAVAPENYWVPVAS